MLLALDAVPKWHNILSAICAWILLAGFVIFPGTFTSIQDIDENAEDWNDVERWILRRIKNIPLLVAAGICCGLGATGMIAFWFRWRNNYVWVCNRIFLWVWYPYGTERDIYTHLHNRPGTLHSLAGILSTVINVYTAQDKQWSITAKVSVIVEGACLVICLTLFLFYSEWLLAKVRKHHDREFGVSSDDEDIGIVEKIKRKARAPSPEPGRIA